MSIDPKALEGAIERAHVYMVDTLAHRISEKMWKEQTTNPSLDINAMAEKCMPGGADFKPFESLFDTIEKAVPHQNIHELATPIRDTLISLTKNAKTPAKQIAENIYKESVTQGKLLKIANGMQLDSEPSVKITEIRGDKVDIVMPKNFRNIELPKVKEIASQITPKHTITHSTPAPDDSFVGRVKARIANPPAGGFRDFLGFR